MAAFEESKTAKQKELDAAVKQLEGQLKEATAEAKADIEKQLKSARELAREHGQLEPPYELLYAVAEKEHAADSALQLKGDPPNQAMWLRVTFQLSSVVKHYRPSRQAVAAYSLCSGCSARPIQCPRASW